MNNKTINIEIEELAGRYFDGTTTVDEERRLRLLLATTGYSSPAADEARALLGFFAAERSRAAVTAKRRRMGLTRSVLTVAASVAVMVAVTVALFRSADSRMECYAMVGSERIEDMDEIRSLIDADLGCIADAQHSINDAIAADLSAISDAMQ